MEGGSAGRGTFVWDLNFMMTSVFICPTKTNVDYVRYVS